MHSLLSHIKSNCKCIAKSVEYKIDICFSRAEIVWLQAARVDTQLVQFALVTFTTNENENECITNGSYAPFAICSNSQQVQPNDFWAMLSKIVILLILFPNLF